MTLNEARKILGLDHEEDSLPHLEEFKVAREHIAAMVRTAPNQTLADRYQKGLLEFDEALSVIREHLEASGKTASPLPFIVPGEISSPSFSIHTAAPVLAAEPPTAAEPVTTATEPSVSPAEPVTFATPGLVQVTPSSPAPTPVPEEPAPTPAKQPFLRPLHPSPAPAETTAPIAVAETPAPITAAKFPATPPADVPPFTAVIPPPARVIEDPPLVHSQTAPTVILKEIAAPRRPGATPSPSPKKTGPLIPAAADGAVATAADPEISAESHEEEERPSRVLSYFAWFLIFLTIAMGGAWLYLQNEESRAQQRLVRIADMEKQGAALVENRRWQEAASIYNEIDSLSRNSEIALRGRRSIEAGMAEEQTQFIGYWTGQATAELEAGRLDEAVKAARQVLERYPTETEAAAILEKIAAARISQSRSTILAKSREALDQFKWDEAISLANQLLSATPDDADAKTIIADATAAKDKLAAGRIRAAELLKSAAARDNGQFDQQALDWLREAASLDPSNKDIADRLEKLSSYSRTLRVPGDFATPAEALASARDRDRIILGAATWQGPLIINAAVELQGAGFNDTKVECSADDGSVITIGPMAKGARVTGISFRHASFAAGSDRYSAALVRGGSVSFVDCRFTEASGHGVAIIDGGQASVSRCRFADNGWNGIAAIGNGSRMEVRDCEALNNFEHGIESWDGAAVILANNRCEGNSRNGIHADNGLASATIEGNQLIGNREFGLVLDSATGGKISNNIARGNMLGGIVIRAAAGNLPVTTNQATANQGPGLVLERGLPAAAYANNISVKNTGKQIMPDMDLTVPETPPDPGQQAATGEAKPTDGEKNPPAIPVIDIGGTNGLPPMDKITDSISDPNADPDAPAPPPPPRARIIPE